MVQEHTYLTTGIDSGLGKYLHSKLNGYYISRESKCIGSREINTVIHCAFNKNFSNLYKYIEDNLFFTKKLIEETDNKNRKFILISSIDVYPKDNKIYSEDENLPLPNDNLYATIKLMVESIVKEKCENYVILRPSVLLGNSMRPNSLIKILNDYNSISLSGDSTFNYVLYEDIFKLIKYIIKKDITGIYNIVSNSNIVLKDICNLYKKKINFGDYIYKTGNISNNKVCGLIPNFNKSSQEVIKLFVKRRENA